MASTPQIIGPSMTKGPSVHHTPHCWGRIGTPQNENLAKKGKIFPKKIFETT